MSYCGNCGKEISGPGNFCEYCGAKAGAPQSAQAIAVSSPSTADNEENLVRRLADFVRMSGWFWIILGVIQICTLLASIAGIWNIIAGIVELGTSKKVRRRDPSVPKLFEGIAGLIIMGVVNIFLGGIIGVGIIIFDVYVRDKILTNRHLFDSIDASDSHSSGKSPETAAEVRSDYSAAPPLPVHARERRAADGQRNQDKHASSFPRFAVIIGVILVVIIGVVLATVAVPAYRDYQQRKVQVEAQKIDPLPQPTAQEPAQPTTAPAESEASSPEPIRSTDSASEPQPTPTTATQQRQEWDHDANIAQAAKLFARTYKQSGIGGAIVIIDDCYKTVDQLTAKSDAKLKKLEYCVGMDSAAYRLDRTVTKQNNWPPNDYFKREAISGRLDRLAEWYPEFEDGKRVVDGIKGKVAEQLDSLR